jgi:hypothetical protein
MINILEIAWSVEYKWAYNTSARACYYIFEQLDKCMFLYKHKLSQSYYINKYGTANPDSINLEKMIGKNLFIFHINMFAKNPEKLREIISFCLKKQINVWIVSNSNTNSLQINEILDEYESNRYDLKEIRNYQANYWEDYPESLKEDLREVIRDINLSKIL